MAGTLIQLDLRTRGEWRQWLEMQVEDPDGNVLRFGCEPKANAPCGVWLDVRGDRWEMKTDGQWTRAEGMAG